MAVGDGRLAAGIDVGSVSSEAVLLAGDQILAAVALPTGANGRVAGERVLESALRRVGAARQELAFVVATGYGRKGVGLAHRAVTEITCHARGARYLMPDAQTVIDIGGQDSKVIRVDGGGTVVDFVMNDRCAAGTGRFLEVMARALEVQLEQLAELSRRASRTASISSTCTVFAESEVVSLVAEGVPREEIVSGLHASVAERIYGMVQRLTLVPPVVMTGGVAHNAGVVLAIEERLGCRVEVVPEPHLVGALGAALIAAEMMARPAS